VSGSLAECADGLRRLVKTDPDPRVRRRAQALLDVAHGAAVIRVATSFGTAAHRVRAWRDRYLDQGRDGLVDKPRPGRPPKLGPAELALLDEALTRGPQAYGWPVTLWSMRDLCELLWQQRQVPVSVDTVHRAVQGLGYRYRRPRHDLRHRQDREAVAATKEVLAWLGKVPVPGTFSSSTWTNARSTGTLGWQRCGSDGGSP
jgi:transposase